VWTCPHVKFQQGCHTTARLNLHILLVSTRMSLTLLLLNAIKLIIAYQPQMKTCLIFSPGKGVSTVHWERGLGRGLPAHQNFFEYLVSKRHILVDIWRTLRYLGKALIFSSHYVCPSAHVAQWSTHLGATCSGVRHATGARFKARSRHICLPPKELFQIIPTHMINREIILGRKKMVQRCPL